MKKRYTLLMFLFLCSSMLFAQVEKGKWAVGCNSNLGLDIGKTKYESSGGGPTSEYKYTEFNFTPYAGYFLIDQLAAGLFMDYEYYKDVDQSDDDYWKNTSFVIGPFVRYYIIEYKKLWPFVSAGIGFGSNKTSYTGISSDEKSKYMTYRFGAGATYFLNDNVGLDLFLGYNNSTTTYDEEDKSMNSSDSKDIDSGFKMSIGLIVSFGK